LHRRNSSVLRLGVFLAVAGLQGACSSVGGPGGSAAYPNEPAGFQPFAEHRLACEPLDTCQVMGTWTHEVGGWTENWSIASDPNTPEGSNSTGQTLFPTGQSAGNAPIQFDGWAAGGYASKFYQKLYLSMWIRVLGTNYENQAVGTKMGFIGYGRDPDATAGNQAFFILIGTGSQAVGSAFELGFWQQGHVSRELSPNVDASLIMTVGAWHHWEALLELNSVGSANGVFKWWVDGTQIMNHSDVVYRTAADGFGFYNYRWNPTWGGIGGTKTRDDYIRTYHIYLSGVE